ncbi:ribonucleoside-diphosphate reductase class II [Candidatus Kryptonium thompsonii]|uniref:Vitamin B12-dependent ribonucleotide reductase n=1 Tax=Candidatus Kryptonium thompsonii TaxID=1633631 RepID=A0A0N7MVY7_9BACT|nr:ribonucleoside-diphosphate reductase class II [Candidatus Kryptonium thompsoni]CUS86549.1 ribonucleoside-diphosphate reductase class II [Candidatus Kryptonium thompsoni]CUS90529.1 ribonucleoside-diphosphate reductase class II [Candidatus Kryptonium thompsoni]CUS91002.1 ribonucleoside-diphosphate reductase class II [Candidatus Kryptonium thompsoni]CUS97155.1 ribonucleoside-diphosphate reductase class II [Candidatus Kryptonium thompsoni]
MEKIKKEAMSVTTKVDTHEEETLSLYKSSGKGLKFHRFFTKPGVHPFDEIQWEIRDAVITNERGEVVFEQKGVEVPAFWSMLATNIVVSKYFHGQVGTPEREYSVKQLIERVARTITNWGIRDGYFASDEDADIFYNELAYLLVNQYASFNSPVWFNVGIEEKPQASACFINSVQDTMESILELVKTEGMLFKYGSGTGTNFSTLRSSKEKLSGGGIASGPVSFMRGFDAFAGVIKSGGKTRRAAKMVILNVDHPDIIDFIKSKAEEEKKAHILIKAGYDPGFNVPGGAYDSVQFQNANHSVRVTDEFMKAVLEDKEWHTRYVTTGEICDTYRARDIMRMIAEAAWLCGDPGMQFDTTINNWHTCPNTGRINASNPCSEFMFLDDTACNLASLNLMKFRKEDGSFDVEAFRHAVDVLITAQEIIVDNASYPTKAIEKNSYDYRPLGLGYANLGALLMSLGLPYDSEPARAYAAVITAIMTGEAYRQSALIAKEMGPFRGYELNREPMLGVIRKHMSYVDKIDKSLIPEELYESAKKIWSETYELGQKYGYRNSQVTVIAPTGTIGFMMDCDTTGIEPDIALVKYKKLVGGGFLKIVNNTVPLALKKLGYTDKQIEEIVNYIDKNDTIEGAPHLKPEHLPVFDCAFKPAKGKRFIHYMGHVKMMAAVQPFISGAISKTVNMPNDVTVDDVMQLYIDAWKMGLKAIAIYRDGSKGTQPLSTSIDDEKKTSAGEEKKVEFKPVRRRLPDERNSITHKFSVAGHEGYITVGMYPDGTPGEIFITMSKEGSTLSGLMDAFATAISLALQYGVPLKVLVDKFSHMRFEPSGFTNNPEIPIAKSIIDYIFRWLGKKFLKPEEQPSNVDHTDILNEIHLSQEKVVLRSETLEKYEKQIFEIQSDAPPCPSCGAIMQRSGSCYVCPNCGSTSGCS